MAFNQLKHANKFVGAALATAHLQPTIKRHQLQLCGPKTQRVLRSAKWISFRQFFEPGIRNNPLLASQTTMFHQGPQGLFIGNACLGPPPLVCEGVCLFKVTLFGVVLKGAKGNQVFLGVPPKNDEPRHFYKLALFQVPGQWLPIHRSSF